MGEIIQIAFKEGQFTYPYREDIPQWNKGLKLQISGLETDKTVQVHFSLTENQGAAKREKTEVIDGVIHADIPHFILAKENCYNMSTYSAYAWVYLTDGEVAETVGEIIFTIKTRAKPEEFVVPEDPSFLEELEAELKNKLSKTGHDPNKYLATDEAGNIVTVDDMETGGDVDLSEYVKKSEHEEALLQFAIKPTTEKATLIHIQDSADYKVLDFEMDGKTEQKTVPGNQLFDLASSNGFVSLYTGLSTEIDVENNTLTTTNTRTTDRTGHLDLGILQSGTYYISFENINDYATMPALKCGELESELTQITAISVTGGSFTIEEQLHCWLVWGVKNDNPLKLGNIMLNKDSTALPIEEYVGGQPSPNPDYPQEIVNAGIYNEETGRYEVDIPINGRNLINEAEYDMTYHSRNVTTNVLSANTSISINSRLFKFPAKKTDYAISINSIDGVTTFRYSVWAVKDNTALKYIERSGNATSRKDIFTNDTDADEIWLMTLDTYDLTVQVEYGTVFNAHEIFKEQLLTLTSPVPLTKWDKLVRRDGVLCWMYKSRLEYEVTGNEVLHIPSTTATYVTGTSTNAFFIATEKTNDASSIQNAYCNCLSFLPVSWNVTDGSVGFCCNTNQIHMRLPNKLIGVSDAAVLEEKKAAFVTYLQQRYANGNPIKFWYELEEVEYDPLPQEEQDALNAAMTYYPVTNVTNDQDCPIQLTYVADTKNYIDNQIASASATTMALALEN